MQRIIQLDDHLANKIAAGEVVERPASVVKELVENAIDAKSTVIEIEVEEAGLQKIRVIDNGSGIEAVDTELAFARHATSKIKDEFDLFRIRSLGFRGEALPSIASVAKLDVKTCTGDGPGTRIVIEGSQLIKTEKCASRKGTDITVTDLFYNTPARLKYMRSLHTELGNITDVVNRLALAHADVSIRLSHNGKVLLQTNGNGDIRQVISAIYGMDIAKKMVRLSTQSLDFKIDGYISLPEVTRASRSYLSLMINGRFIRNYGLARAIAEGYHTLLPIGRHPIAVLHIEMDPLLVDVNVHPTKLEVRLSKEKELEQLITEAIKDVFKDKVLIPDGARQKESYREETVQSIFHLDHLSEQDEQGQEKTNNQLETEKVVFQQPDQRHPIVGSEATEIYRTDEEEVAPVAAKIDRVPPLYPIGQMHGTYIFAQNEHGLYMIDQHAAQERIKYEFYKEKVGQVTNELQELLLPLTLEFSLDEYVKIAQYKEELQEVGIFLEPFGQTSYIVRSHPVWFPTGREAETIEEIIHQALAMRSINVKKLREEAAIMMSCKASIKANEYLRTDDMQALLDELRQTTDPFTCPHGRPVMIHYATYELEKMFKRVM